MILRPFTCFAAALTVILAPFAAFADGVWEGSWNTTYPDLNLIQDGRLVYGEYEGRGWIVGLTDVGGSVLRGAWVYDTGRWGALELRMQPGGSAFVGEWAEATTSFTYGSGTNWSGTRQSFAPMTTPEFNSQIEWPMQFDFDNPAVLAWLRNGFSVAPAPAPAPLVSASCPEVAMPLGLSAGNNPHVTAAGIADATSAPWTIYGQPAAAPLGSLSFRGDRLNLRLDACVPLFGQNVASQRRVIEITDAVLVVRGDGDFQGSGWFHDPGLGMRGAVSLYLTNPAQGQGLAALTITGEPGTGWAESVLLDYSAD